MGGTVFLVYEFPRPWPVASDTLLFSNVVDSTTVSLIARSDGSLTLTIEPKGGSRRIHQFQRLQFTGSGRVILNFSWDDHGVSLQINQSDLLLGEPAQLPVLALQTKGEVEPPPMLVFPGLDRSSARTEAEALFLGTTTDLDKAILEQDWYTALRASGYLRQLLLEGLIHRANDRHDVHFAFRTNEFDSEPPLPDYQARWIGLDPSRMPTVVIRNLDLDEFLAVRRLVYNGAVATVKDTIRACANAKGGIHLGKPKPGGEAVVVSFDEICNVLGLPTSSRAVLGLCRITLEAVKPLVNSILARK